MHIYKTSVKYGIIHTMEYYATAPKNQIDGREGVPMIRSLRYIK